MVDRPQVQLREEDDTAQFVEQLLGDGIGNLSFIVLLLSAL
jgi:hypothetical protein